MITNVDDKRIGVKNGQIVGIDNIFLMMGIDVDNISKERPWTPDGGEYLIDLYLKGWTAEEIAEEMNRTPGNVIGKIYDLGDAGTINMSMWGTKNNGDKLLPEGIFKLFTVHEEQKEGA